MQIGSGEWNATVIQGSEALGHALTPDQARQMATHAQLLIEWNRRTNLTSITDPMQVAVKHVLDAIAPLHLLPAEGALLDIGTGGGFPGIPLKIMKPALSLTLIDSVRKKISFVNYVIRELRLARIEALHIRVQDLAVGQNYLGRFQTIVCRALTDLKRGIYLSHPLLAPKGRFIAYQGPNDPSFNEVADSDIRANFSCIEQISYQLPFLGDERKVLVLQKI